MKNYIVLDIETTGTKPLESDIIEIGAVYVEDGRPKEKFSTLVKPNELISEYITSITGITNEMVQDAAPIEEVMPAFIAFCQDLPLVGHNIDLFDYRMLKVKAERLGLSFEHMTVDTLMISRQVLADLPSRRLGDLCTHYQIDLVHAHRAYDDAYATYELLTHLEAGFKDEAPQFFIPKVNDWKMPKHSPITAKQKNYLLNLCKAHKIELEKPIERFSKSDASKRIDGILRDYGR
ncbi:MAG: exonuclease domain-containing protein [Niameybacter sp.]